MRPWIARERRPLASADTEAGQVSILGRQLDRPEQRARTGLGLDRAGSGRGGGGEGVAASSTRQQRDGFGPTLDAQRNARPEPEWVAIRAWLAGGGRWRCGGGGGGSDSHFCPRVTFEHGSERTPPGATGADRTPVFLVLLIRR